MPVCISCNQNKNFVYVSEKKVTDDYTLKLIRCEQCKLVFVENPPPEQTLSKIYADDSFYDRSNKPDQEEIKARIGILEYAEEMVKQNTGKLLDIGAAKGYLVAAAKQKGWDSFGIEYSKHYADYGNNLLGVKIFQGEIFEILKNINEKFDIIIIWHTLEHVLQPYTLLLKCAEKLSTNGIIAIQVPDYEKLGESIVGVHHVSYFTPDSLLNLVKNSNLKILSYDYDFTNKFISVRIRI